MNVYIKKLCYRTVPAHPEPEPESLPRFSQCLGAMRVSSKSNEAMKFTGPRWRGQQHEDGILIRRPGYHLTGCRG